MLSDENKALVMADLGQTYWEPNDCYVWLSAADEDDLQRLLDAARAERQSDLLEALKDTTVHLVAAASLLQHSPKTAAPSNKMFDQMVCDY